MRREGVAKASEGNDRNPDEIIDSLSIEEKIGQLVGSWIGSMGRDVDIDDAKAMIREQHLGSVAAFGIGVSWYHDPQRVAEIANELQRTAIEETSHGIPVFLPVDAVHGHAYVDEATVFPHGLGIAATRNPDLARSIGEITATEMRATGATVNYGPTGDVVRDPRWGRTFETFGESPFLCAEMTGAVVSGLEDETAGDRIASTIKHFPAYGDPVGGEDTGPVECAPETVYETFLPPFEAAIDAGASFVMPCYNAVNRDVPHGSPRLLTDLLRTELGFDGAVLSDWGGVDMLVEDHGIARDRADAARQALGAGLDLISIGGPDYAKAIGQLVADGALPEERIDEAVRRVLRVKIDLGLFEDPFVDPDAVRDVVGVDEHRAFALEAARSSQTLLKNDGILPIDSEVEEILVTGPNADSLQHQFGGWSVDDPKPDAGSTVRTGLESVVSDDTVVRYEPGAEIARLADVDAAAQAAEDADIAVVVLGENWYFHEFGPHQITGPTGTFPTRTQLELPDAQRTLLERIHETGTPTVLVLVTGRPLSIPWAAEAVPGILLSYYPGSEGGRAIAETLVGEHNPSGRLPISVPRSTGHLPDHIDFLAHPTPIGDDEHPPSYDPLFAFGHGLSYTEFEIREFSVDEPVIEPPDDIELTVELENVGDRDGRQSVDFFLRDEVASRVRPVRQHVGFETAHVPAGERVSVTATISNDALGVPAPHGGHTIEPGQFTLFCEDETETVEVVDAS